MPEHVTCKKPPQNSTTKNKCIPTTFLNQMENHFWKWKSLLGFLKSILNKRRWHASKNPSCKAFFVLKWDWFQWELDSKVQFELKFICPAIHFRNAPLRRHNLMWMTRVLGNEHLLMQNKTNYDNHHVNKIRNPCGFVM